MNADEEPKSRLCTHCGFSIEADNPADLCEVCLEDSHHEEGPDSIDYDAPSLAERLELDHRDKEGLR